MKKKEERNEFSKDVMDKLCIHVRNKKKKQERNKNQRTEKGRWKERRSKQVFP